MTEQEDPSRERLKNHLAQRVTHQARQILELWQRLQANEWSPTSLAELDDANLRLLRFAKRFEQLCDQQRIRPNELVTRAGAYSKIELLFHS